MRLKWLCSHEFAVIGTNRGENLLGSVTYAVELRCRRCLKVRRVLGYSSEASARRAADRLAALMNGEQE